MSQFTGLLSATGLGSIQNLGLVLVDNTPNAVDWTNISTGLGTIASIGQQITGIDSSIIIKLNATANGIATISYGTNTTNTTPSAWTQIGSGAPFSGDTSTFSVSNNQWLFFQFTRHAFNNLTTVTIINTTDNNTTLDTLTVNFTTK